MPSELNVWSTIDTNWKNTSCSSEQVHWVQIRFIPGFCPFCSEEVLAHIFFMGAMLQSLRRYLALLYFYPPCQRPHQVLRLSHQHALALAKTAVQGPWRNKLIKAPFFISCPTTCLGSSSLAITHQLWALSGCAECYWECSVLLSP